MLATITKKIPSLIKFCETAQKTARYSEGLTKIWEETGFWNPETPCREPNFHHSNNELNAELLLICARLHGFITHRQEISKNFLTKANDLFTVLDNPERQLLCSNYLALAYWRTGEIAEAKTWLQNALTFKLPPGNPAKLHTFIVESLVNHTSRKHFEILSRLNSQSANFINCNDNYLRGLFYMNRGLAKGNLGDPDAALRELSLASDIFRQLGHHPFLASCDNNKAFFYHAKGDIQTATEYAKRSLQAAQKTNDKRQIACAWDTLAGLAFAEENYKQSLEYSDKAISELENTECYYFRVEYLDTKIKTLRKINKKSAYPLYHEAMAIAGQFCSEEICDRLTDTINGVERKQIQIIPQEENSVRLQFPFEPAGETFALRISTGDYINFGLLRDSLVVIEKGSINNGDPAALQVNETGDYRLGFIDSQFGVVGLEVGNDLEAFNESEVQILGKVIGYCPNPPDAEGYYKVVSFE